MKEFKFDVDGSGIQIPVIRCETQREFNQAIAGYRTGGKLSTNDPDGEVIYIIYKDGSTFYHNSADVSMNEGKYKRTGILRGVSSNPNGYEVFGDFAIDEYGNIVIDDELIEEYGVYAGQYDVTEQDEQEVQKTVEQAAEQETTETVEGISKMETTTETDDSEFEYTTSQAQEIIMTGTSIAREKYREKHNIHSPMDLKKFSKKQLDDYLSKEIDYINKFLNDTLPKEVFNAMKGEIMYA